MSADTPIGIIEQPFHFVKSNNLLDSSPSPASMAPHNVSISPHNKMIVSYNTIRGRPYGVSPAKRVLSPQALLKHLDVIKVGLQTRIGLTPRQADITIELLRLWAYYGSVYPKASQVAGEPEISDRMAAWRAENGLAGKPANRVAGRATFWRTIKVLEGLGLVQVIKRYVVRDHAQISNLYKLDQLVLVLARYIAERRQFSSPSWLAPVFAIDPSVFWSFLHQRPGERPGLALPALAGILSD